MEVTLGLAVAVALGGWIVPLFSSMVVARLILVSFGRLARRNAYVVKYASFAAAIALFTIGVVWATRVPGVTPVWIWIAYGWSVSSSLNSLIDADRQRITGRRAAKAAGGFLLRRGRRWRIMWRHRSAYKFRRGKTPVARWIKARPSLRDGA